MGADISISPISDHHTNMWNSAWNASLQFRNNGDSAVLVDILPRYRAIGQEDFCSLVEKQLSEENTDPQELVEFCFNKMFGGENPGYFRDSYNSSSLLSRLGLSWWQDVGEHLDDNGLLHEEGIRWLLKEVKNRELAPVNDEDVHPKETVEEVEKYFHDKRERFIRFLELALEHGLPLSCSI